MSFKKFIASSVICATIITGNIFNVHALSLTYRVQQDDTLWTISDEYQIPFESILKANNANEYTRIYPGQNVIIPLDSSTQTLHTVSQGETYWTISKKYGVDFYKLLASNSATEQTKLNVGEHIIVPVPTPRYILHTIGPTDSFWTLSQKYKVDFYALMSFNGANEKSVLIDGEQVKIPITGSAVPTPTPKPVQTPAPTPTPKPSPAPVAAKPYVTYTTYKLQAYDTLWNVSIKFGIPFLELLRTNNLTEWSVVRPGTILKIPVHHVPAKTTPGLQYGEYLDWWTEAQYVIPIGADFEVVDFYTGKSFFSRRTTGANHADCEPLSLSETRIMKSIWGGNFSWSSRPVIIKYKGRKIAASVSAMPHAGNDNAPGGVYTSWRSGGYGPGQNFDWIKGNGADGHFDIHFVNSTRHKDGKIDLPHQINIKTAAGIK